MMVKLSNSLKIIKFILPVCFLAIVFGQDGEIIPLSQKVGLTLDAEENLFYNQNFIRTIQSTKDIKA